MAGKTRIYQVRTLNTIATTHLVEATSQAAAWRALAEKAVEKPTLPSGKEIAALMGVGVKVEEAAGE